MSKITIERELLEQAIAALSYCEPDWKENTHGFDLWANVLPPLREALAQPQPVQEPVAWIEREWGGSGLKHLHFERREPSVRDEVMNPVWTPLYTSPQAQPLSDERLCEAMRKAADELLDHIYEFSTISEGVNPRLLAVGRAVEAAITKGTT